MRRTKYRRIFSWVGLSILAGAGLAFADMHIERVPQIRFGNRYISVTELCVEGNALKLLALKLLNNEHGLEKAHLSTPRVYQEELCVKYSEREGSNCLETVTDVKLHSLDHTLETYRISDGEGSSETLESSRFFHIERCR